MLSGESWVRGGKGSQGLEKAGSREGWLVSETERVQETQGLARTEHTASTVTGPVTTRAGGTLVRRKLDMFHLLTVYCII